MKKNSIFQDNNDIQDTFYYFLLVYIKLLYFILLYNQTYRYIQHLKLLLTLSKCLLIFGGSNCYLKYLEFFE